MHKFMYTRDQLFYIKLRAYRHSQLEAQKDDPDTLRDFLEGFFLNWDLLYPENLTGLGLEARRWARKHVCLSSPS